MTTDAASPYIFNPNELLTLAIAAYAAVISTFVLGWDASSGHHPRRSAFPIDSKSEINGWAWLTKPKTSFRRQRMAICF